MNRSNIHLMEGTEGGAEPVPVGRVPFVEPVPLVMAEALSPWTVGTVRAGQEDAATRNARQVSVKGYVTRRCELSMEESKRTVKVLMGHTLGGRLITGGLLNSYFDVVRDRSANVALLINLGLSAETADLFVERKGTQKRKRNDPPADAPASKVSRAGSSHAATTGAAEDVSDRPSAEREPAKVQGDPRPEVVQPCAHATRRHAPDG